MEELINQRDKLQVQLHGLDNTALPELRDYLERTLLQINKLIRSIYDR